MSVIQRSNANPKFQLIGTLQHSNYLRYVGHRQAALRKIALLLWLLHWKFLRTRYARFDCHQRLVDLRPTSYQPLSPQFRGSYYCVAVYQSQFGLTLFIHLDTGRVIFWPLNHTNFLIATRIHINMGIRVEQDYLTPIFRNQILMASNFSEHKWPSSRIIRCNLHNEQQQVLFYSIIQVKIAPCSE